MTASDSVDETSTPISNHRTETYKSYHDWTNSESLTQSVIEAVVVATDADIGELAPLYTVINPDALDRLFTSVASTDRMEGTVSFTYHGCTVRVSANGKLVVQTLTGGASD